MVIGFSVPAALVAPEPAHAATGQDIAAGTPVFSDSFTRSTTGSWGAASPFCANGAQGVIDLARSGTAASAAVPVAAPADSETTVRVIVSRVPTQGNGVYAGVQQRVDGASYYQSSVRVDSAGDARLSVVRVNGSTAAQTTVVANLALSLSEGGRRVLLVDAGLTTVLVGKALIEDVVQPWGDGTLHVLTSGEIPPNPSELLASARMEELVARARATYDVIVIDTAPLIAVADAAFVARMTDGAIVVADQTRVHRGQLLEALDAVEKSGGPVLGVVLNKVRPTKDKSAYYRAETEQTGRAARAAGKAPAAAG